MKKEEQIKRLANKEFITKKALFEILENAPEEDAASKTEVQRIKDLLTGFSDEEKVDMVKSLQDFLGKGGFSEVSRFATPRNYAQELQTIVTELQSWISRRIRAGTIFEMASAEQNKRRKNRIKSRIVWICILAAFGIAAIVFTVLHFARHKFEWVSEIIGLVDLVFGLSFFAYEQIDDLHKNDFHNKAETAAKRNDPHNVDNYKTFVDNSRKIKGICNIGNSIEDKGGDIHIDINGETVDISGSGEVKNVNKDIYLDNSKEIGGKFNIGNKM